MITLPLCQKNRGTTTTPLLQISDECAREGKRAGFIGGWACAATLLLFAKIRHHGANLLARSSLTLCATRVRVGAPPALPERIRVAASAETARALPGRELADGSGTH
jgi:hypothetical protein